MNTPDDGCSRAVAEALAQVLAKGVSLRDPMNALVVWTELGKGLAGTLDRKGADVGLLGRIIDNWCASKGDPVRELASWVYRPATPLDEAALALVLGSAQTTIESIVAAQAGGDEDGGKQAFLAAVRGWFPVGLHLMRRICVGRGEDAAASVPMLRAWCERYLPKDSSGPTELGVRVQR